MALSSPAEPPPSDRDARDPLIGALINGKYRVERSIARGGMGRIYYAVQAPLDRPVALKVVKADSVDEDESQFLKRFLLEASILAKLQHPNVVTLFDYGRIENVAVEMYFIAMEFLAGETLTARIRGVGALSSYETLGIFRQIARGLREAHGHGVIHRDLKPSNIVLIPAADGEIVKIVDFGIGKVEAAGEDLTRDGVLVGTPKYMAPEQFEGISSPATDVYAFGTIAYQMLAGQAPFRGSKLTDFITAKLVHPVPLLRDMNPAVEVPASVEQLIYHMLARHPADRPTLDDVFGQLAICEDDVFGTSGARLSLSGGTRTARPQTSSSAPYSVQTMHLPYPSVGSMPPGYPAHGSGPVTGPFALPTGPYAAIASSSMMHAQGSPTGPHMIPGGMGTMPYGVPPAHLSLTPRPMVPELPPPSGGTARMGIAIAAILLLLMGGIGGVVLMRPKGPPGPAQTGETKPAVSTLPVATTFTVRIESAPTGATVTDVDGVTLGTTPLDIKIERADIGTGSRVFQIKKDGFVATSLTQAVSDTDVRQEVTLAPVPEHTVKSPTAPPHTARPVIPAKPAGTPTGDSDIRLKR